MRLAIGLLLILVAGSAQAESWSCTYPGYGKDRAAVRAEYELINGKLTSKKWGTEYQVVINNRLAVVAVEASALVDGTGRRINATTIIIDRERGGFIHMVGEIGDEPGYAVGLCTSP